MSRRLIALIGMLVWFLFLPVTARAQGGTDGDNLGGLVPYQSFHGGDIDVISMSNGKPTVRIPLISYPQRGSLKLSFSLVYSGLAPSEHQACEPKEPCFTYWTAYGSTNLGPVDDQQSVVNYQVVPVQGSWVYAFTVGTPDGSSHPIPGAGESWDATGFRTNGGGSQTLPTVLKDNVGIRYYQPGSSGGVLREDQNGNQISVAQNGDYTDTMGRVIPAFANASPTTDYSHCTGNPATYAVIWTVPGPNGGTSQFKFCYVNNAGYSLQSVVLPNNTAWTFAYGNSGLTGCANDNVPITCPSALTQITMPTGGTISYVWEKLAVVSVWPSYWVASRTVNANDGTGSHTWNYNWGSYSGSGTVNIVTAPPDSNGVRNDTAYTETSFTGGMFGQLYTTLVQYYQGSHTGGTLLKTVETDYNSNYFTNTTAAGPGTLNLYPIRTKTTWAANNKVSKVEKDYDAGSGNGVTYGQVIAQREYDYGSGAPGPLLRQTITSYMAWSGPNSSSYMTNNIVAIPYTVQIQDGGGTQRGYTYYGYDEYTLASSGIGSTQQHDPNPPDGTYRGNQTSVHHWLNTNSSYLTSTKTFYDTGMVNVAIDPIGNSTTFNYSTTYVGALLAQVTNALTQNTYHSYDFNTGLLTSTTDPNNQPTNLSYDSMWRVYQVTHPDGGLDTITHQETNFPFTATLTRKITSGQNYGTTNVFDGPGRVSQGQITSDPQGTIFTDFTYDALGRKYTASNPYRSTSDPTYGITTYNYDALGRPTKVIPPDGTSSSNNVVTQYCGNVTMVTDQSGHWRRSTADGLGRLIEVDEPNSPTATVNVCPGTGEQIWVTTYTYDTLNNLASVVQGSSRQRTFVHDSLSRMTSSTNPEAGGVAYTYDADSNVKTKTDARGITITYYYDALNRMTSRTYSNGDPTITYNYDQTTYNGFGITNGIGRRTSMTDAAGSEAWSYDAMGRELTEQRATNGLTKTTSYTYNFDGSLATLTYPSGRTVTYGYDSAQRPSTAQDITNNVNYALGTCGTLGTGVCYAPQGAVTSAAFGQSGSNGFNLTDFYNTRLQPCRMFMSTATAVPSNCTDASQTGNILDLTYSFVDTNSNNNGNVMSAANNRDTTRSQSFTYDQVNRILTAKTQSTSGGNCWGLNFGYDQWANLTAASVSQCSAPALSLGVNTSNQLTNTGFSYDASGNVLGDGTNSYTWDAESQIKAAAGVNYTYDGDGNRVQKSNGKLYWYGSGTEILDESDLNGNITDEYVFFGGKRIAHRTVSSGNIYYYAEDFIGNSRVIIQAGQTAPCYDGDFYPFGGERTVTNTCPQNYKFQGKERDAETGSDDFGARYYSSSFGRWLSPDWSAVPTPVPYADLTNPQTLNLYQFVKNDPETFTDPDGHYHCGPACILDQGGGGSMPQDPLGQTSSLGPLGPQKTVLNVTILRADYLDARTNAWINSEIKTLTKDMAKAGVDVHIVSDKTIALDQLGGNLTKGTINVVFAAEVALKQSGSGFINAGTSTFVGTAVNVTEHSSFFTGKFDHQVLTHEILHFLLGHPFQPHPWGIGWIWRGVSNVVPGRDDHQVKKAIDAMNANDTKNIPQLGGEVAKIPF